VHGITGDTRYMLEAMKEVNELPEKADFILTYDYENLSTPIPAIAEHLYADLEAAGFANGNFPELFIVAHSMGGLVSRWLIEKITGKPVPVQHLVLVGTPSAGSEMATLGKSALGMLTHALNVTGPVKYVITGLSFLLKKLELDPLATLGELKPGSKTLEQLAGSNKNDHTTYTIIGGDTSMLKNGYDGEDFFLKKISHALMNKIVYPGLTNNLFKDESNDMAVTIKSMRAVPGTENINDSMIIASNHCGYFMDKDCRARILSCLEAK
jgi:triacylglycerol esterase/lipase EstA (alpha/beta hydrolase family)